MDALLKPTYVWRMAHAMKDAAYTHGKANGMRKSARTRMRNAERVIDELVVQRARELGMVHPDE